MRKMHKKTTIAVITALCLTILLSLFYSCEIGLGSAVDTQPPVVSITYPPSLSVIRDSFVLAGTWSDDQKVDDVFVEVYLNKEDKHSLVYKNTAEITLEGTWSITLNEYNEEELAWYNGWQFCDGDYEIQVYAKDIANHISGTASRTFSIDNTAPVLLLTNPTSAGSDSSPAVYGQIVQLAGAFYEASGKISNLVVSFYDKNGNAICDSTFSNITSMSDSSPLTIARYYSTDEERTANQTVFDNYVSLLGQENILKFENKENIENAKIYFTVTAKDNAKVYENPGDNGTGNGNSTKYFYRGTTPMQNLVSGDGGIEDFTLADFAMFLNGTSKQYSSYADKINEIAASARSLSVTNETNQNISEDISNNNSKEGKPVYLTFVLNPKNNPMYTVGGYEKISTPVSQSDKDNYSDEGFKYLYTGTPVPINISVGADNKNLSTHTVSIFRLDRTNLTADGITGEINQTAFKDLFKKENNDKYFSLMWTWDSEIVEAYNEWGIDKSSLYTSTDEDSNSASLSKQFVIDNFEAGHDYELFVLGEDITGNNIIYAMTKGYGFCGKVLETAPVVSVEDGFAQNRIINQARFTGTNAKDQNDVLFLSGKIKTEKALVSQSGLSYTLTITDSSDTKQKVSLTKNITPQKLTQAPDYTNNYTACYCYTTKTTLPYEYSWRFTTADFANDDSVKALIAKTGSYELSLELVAKNSETSVTTITRTYTLDNLAPVPELSEISVAAEDKTETNAYWINPTKNLTIKGLVTDNLSTARSCKTWVKLVALSNKNTETATNESGSVWDNHENALSGVNKWSFDIPVNAFKASYFGANLYIYSEDVAGNVNVAAAIPLWFDKEAPQAKHIIDTSLKDLYFRVGEQDRDDFVQTVDGNIVGTSGLAFDDNLDRNVGGKYSDGTYGNANTITIRGNFEDTGSGVKMIYYKVYQGQNNDPTEKYDTPELMESLKKDVMEHPTGKFTPLTENVTKRVFYNDNTGTGTIGGQLQTGEFSSVTGNGKTKYWTQIDSNFLTTITGLESNTENYLVLVAVDNVGNSQVDAKEVNGKVYNNFKLNIDNIVPTITVDNKFSESQYYRPVENGKFEIYGIAKDSENGDADDFAAGIRSITIKANGKEISKDKTTYGTVELVSSGTYNKNKVWWKAELKNNVFEGKTNGESVSVQAIVTDNAGTGNTETYPVASIIIDSNAPSVTIKSPAKNSTVNKTITVSVTTSDGNGSGFDKPDETADEAKPKLLYSYDNTNWNNSNIVPGYDDSGWNFTVDTTVFTDNKPVYIKVEAEDKVGNIGSSKDTSGDFLLNVNQDSDRPVVTFSNISLTDKVDAVSNYVWLKNTTKIIGTVSDDDGITTDEQGKQIIQISLDNTNWKDVTLNGSSFSYDIQNFYENETDKEKAANGNNSIYFKITDKAGTEFVSSSTSSLSAIKISDGTTTYGDETNQNTILYVQVDTQYPEIILKGAKLSSAQDFTTAYNNIKLGGPNKSFDVKFTAEDKNGMNEDSFAASTAEFVFTKDDGTSDKVTLTNPSKTTTSKPNERILTFTLSEGENGDLSKLAGYEGSVGISIVGKDTAGNLSKQTASIGYDFKDVDVTFSNPPSTTTMNGNITAYGGLSDTAYISYAISPTEDAAPGTSFAKWTDGDGNLKDLNGTVEAWHKIDEPLRTWTINFDNNLDSTTGVHQKSLNKYIIDYGIAAQDAESNAQDGIDKGFITIVKLYLWIKTVDLAGNENIAKHPILIDPQGDRPSVTFSYPTTNGSTLGGEVSMYGTATDIGGNNIGVDSVWVQIKSNLDANATSFTLTKDDLDYMAEKGYNVYKISAFDVTPEADNTKWTKGSSSLGQNESADDWAALANINGVAWNLSINKNKEFDPPKGTDINPIGIRIYARDLDGKLSQKDERYVSFDANTPIISDLYLVQSSDEDLETASTATKAYSQDMYVKGEWYLTGTITDGDAIKELQIGDDVLVENGAIISGWEDKVALYDKDGNLADSYGATVKFKYKLTPAEGNGSITPAIAATDNAGTNAHTGTENISVKYDNTPPVIAKNHAEGLNISSSIQQNNSWYTFSSKAMEPSAQDGTAQSGFAYTAFYFVRNNTVNNKTTLYDVLKARDKASINITNVTIAALGSEESTADNTIVSDSGLYWYRKTVGRPAVNILEVDDSDEGKLGIRKNALIKMGGVMYLITDVSGNSITINGNVDTSITTAYVAIAGIVDNTTPEGDGNTIQADGYYENPSRDDGDRMIESVDKSGTTWEWSASICSRNISDGPVTLHYVVFDKAGNFTQGSVDGTVSNNRPRIAGVIVKTDYNGDGDVTDAGETINNYSILFNDAYKEYYTGGEDLAWIFDPEARVKNTASKKPLPTEQTFGDVYSPVAVLRGYTKIQPEIVGGNDGIYYSYKIGDGGTNPDGVNKEDNNGKTPCISTGSTDYTANTGSINVQLGDLLSFGDTTNASTATPFEFTFWDSTEGTVKFDSDNPSQTAKLTLYFAIQAQVVGTPTVEIQPFYWNDLNDNSIYESSKAKSYEDLQGHIELEDDWKKTDKYKKTGEFIGGTYSVTEGEYDADPKVSGKIVIKGSAKDNKLINSIDANIYGTEKTVAEYENGKLVSKFSKADFEKADNPNAFWFEIEEPQTINENGHAVNWKLYIDTERILAKGVGIDQNVTITAKNFGIPTASTTENGTLTSIDGSTKYAEEITYGDGTPATDSYQMDIVPYITGVTTALASLKQNNPSVYARTALGHYAVADSEKIKISGFNLKDGTISFDSGDAAATYTNSDTEIPIPSAAKSGNLTIKVTDAAGAEVISLNNLNNNNGNGAYSVTTDSSTGDADIYKNYYNRQPNGDNNNLLTDDVVMDVWEINPMAVKPKIGTATQPVMQIDPVNEHIGFAFVNGSVYFSMPRGKGTTVDGISENSYEYWIGGLDFWNSVCFTYDSNGYVYGVAAGGDLNASKHGVDTFRLMTSRWNQKGSLKTDGYADANGQFGIEFIGEREYGQNDDGTYYGFTNFSKERIKSPSMEAVASSDSTKSTLYLAYYDSINDEVRFKWGVITNSKDTSDDVGMFANDYDPGTRCSQPYSISYSSLIAGQTIGKLGNSKKLPKYDNKKDDEYNNALSTVIPVSKPVTTEDGDPVCGGEFVDIAVIPNGGTNGADDAVIAVWWDGTNHKMLYSFNETPKSINKGEYLQTDTGWSTPVELFGSEIGEYCKVTADKNGGIHVAAYDSLNGDLWYAYVPEYDHPENAKAGCIDSYGFVGNELNIEVALDENNNVIPYIGYYALSCSHPKIAKWSGVTTLSSASSVAGVENEAYTNNWESSVIPTSSKTTIDHVTVGVWKNEYGQIKNSKTGTTEKVTTGDTGPTINSYGFVYGNGTSNPVLGYATKSGSLGYIETAQMK